MFIVMGWKNVSSLDGAEILPYNIFVLLVDLVERVWTIQLKQLL